MKRKLLFIGMLLLFSTATAFAQIENEIDQSKSEQIRKGRDYLLEKFLDRDYDKVKEIKDYLLGLETDDYKAFKYYELWYIMFWTQEFDALAESFRQADSAFFANQLKKAILTSGPDGLGYQLFQRNYMDEHLLRCHIQNANLSEEDKAFLNLFLDWDLIMDDFYVFYPRMHQGYFYVDTRINELADKFLAQYPNSDYEWFVRHMIRKVFVDKKWGWGMGLDLCTGISTGTFARPIGGLGLSMDVVYKKLDFMLGYEVVFGKTVVDVPYTNNSVPAIYPKGSHSNTIVWYANLSYPVWENERWRLAPFIGIGGEVDTYPQNQYQYPESDLYKKESHTWTGNVGLCLDSQGFFADGPGVMRIKYQLGVGLPDGKVATMHVFSLGWTYIIRGKERVY